MHRVVALALVRLMIALVVLEFILPTLLPHRPSEIKHTHVSQPFSAVVLTLLFAGLESEKMEEIADKTFSVPIADLMQNLYFLSRVRETPRQNVFFNHHYDHPPSFLALICVLKI